MALPPKKREATPIKRKKPVHESAYFAAYLSVSFWDTHAFAKMNTADQQHYQQQFRQALNYWPTFWQHLPEEWLDENESTTAFDQAAVLKQLENGADGTIWRKFR